MSRSRLAHYPAILLSRLHQDASQCIGSDIHISILGWSPSQTVTIVRCIACDHCTAVAVTMSEPGDHTAIVSGDSVIVTLVVTQLVGSSRPGHPHKQTQCAGVSSNHPPLAEFHFHYGVSGKIETSQELLLRRVYQQ